MSATTTLCHPSRNQKLVNCRLFLTPDKTSKLNSSDVLKMENLEKKVPLHPILNDGSVSNNINVASDISETNCVKELAAALERLDMEKEFVNELQSNFHSDKKLAISPKAFKEGATSSNKAADVKMLVENRNSCFRQYSDCFDELRKAVLGEYNKWLCEEEIEVTRSVECSNEQVDEEESKCSEESKLKENLEGSEISISSNDDKDPPRISFEIDFDGVRDYKKLQNFAKNCRVLATRFLRVKEKIDRLPSDCDTVVLEGLYREVKAYPFHFKLLEHTAATSEKMEVYLERTCDVLSNLVINFPCFESENINEKRKSVRNFAIASEAMGTLLQTLNIPLSKLAYMVETGSKYYKDLISTSLNDIFNLVRYFKTLLGGDLPCRDDLISWAYDLQDCAFAMCHCEPCFSSVLL